jgi:NADPH:quinone reductase-like Zn-dependent oxidoreductase
MMGKALPSKLGEKTPALTYNPETDAFRLIDLPVPQPGEKEVSVQVDAKISPGKTLVPLMAKTWVPGLDVSGQIGELGSKMER